MNTDFELIQDQEVPELKTRAKLYRHTPTGAELLSLENDDENKVFGITFRTPISDSTGVPHIMEHSVLCGSEKYPLKEPFVELVKGSLNTFLNAFTYSDKTCYPVASQNLQDFYNLIDVYMDAVLHPLIPPHTLKQEGWHYELDDPAEPLSFKGVVFNEMKGAYSDPDNLLQRYAQQSLFAGHPYGYDSGGDPRIIPNLTYEQFKHFHETYYHPSNARIFFYGDDDPEERLDKMAGYLKGYTAISVGSEIPFWPALKTPQRMTIPYDAGEEEAGEERARKGILVMNWVLAETAETETALALQILTHILIGTPAAPLRKALIDSGLGEDLAGDGLDMHLRQMTLSTGLKGLLIDDEYQVAEANKVENLILSTLAALASDGIDPETVAASLNTSEFRLRENNTGAFPRGLSLMLRALTTWIYDSNPVAPLAFEAPLAAIKNRVAAGEKYFEGLIRRYLIENTHRSTLILKPEPGLRQRQDAEERQRLEQARLEMTAAQLAQVAEDTRHLKLLQETPDSPEALAKIPALKLSDLDRKNRAIPLEIEEQHGCTILYHDLFTNGIVYLDLGFDLRVLPQELTPYIPLFGRALLEMGTLEEDFVRLSQRIGRDTGGIRPAVLNTVVRNSSRSTHWIFLRGKATAGQMDKLLAILLDVLLTVNLDNRERFKQMTLEEKADQEAGLVPGGHRVVNTRLRGFFDQAGWLDEQTSGVSYLFFLRELAEKIEKDWPAVRQDLERVRSLLVNRQVILCNVTLDAENWAALRPELGRFLGKISAAAPEYQTWQPGPADSVEGLTIPAQVNYVGKGANLYALGYSPDGSIDVITNYLRTTWLWERVRVQGGAYGGFCLFNPRSGVFTYLSYRDPNLLNTLENYDRSGEFLQNLEEERLSPDELAKSIIGAIGDLDTYQLPDARGFSSMVRYLAEDTEELRQEWREQILDTSLEDFHRFGQALDRLARTGKVVVLGSQDAITAANAGRQDWMQVRKVL